MSNSQKIEDVIIIGGACAGLTAGIYTARANLNPLLIEGYQSGGQLMLTSEVENYPGFPEGILGPDLMQKFRAQAERFGTRFLTKDVTKVDFSKRPFLIQVEKEELKAHAVIISTGASANLLGLQNESRLMGKGVSTCATCDGAFFKDAKVCVAGGGDSALEEAIFLTKFASEVTLIHRRDELRASKIMQDRAHKNKKIKFIWDTVITDVLGQDQMTGLKLKNKKTNAESEIACEGLFVAIGHTPNTKLFKGQLNMHENGYIDTLSNRTQTSVEGVFAAGDVQDHFYRQAVTAAGSGCQAAIECEKFLANR
ncbi:MAG: thioredoxin-disulfide reductase [Deltaproteobacteria bacterium RIFCSPHIGHO2_02_FULL_40_11]|nr:MAG: thioredoxin-disulfide reductase [Deltaproteobacteria bacterium RIFCSPHIGHO2_02_FULL_40_11]